MIARTAAALAVVVSWAPSPTDGREAPTGDELGWLVAAPWAKVGLVVTVAVIVLVAGNMLARSRPKRRGSKRPAFDLEVARLEDRPVSRIADASAGPVHVEGTIAAAEGGFGDPGPGQQVFHNQVGQTRAAAIAADLVMIADSSGRAVLESLDQARVIAPRERGGPRETIGLYVGDRVQVLGEFLPEADEGEDGERVYGGFGGSQYQVRVLERPPRADDAPAAD